MAATFTGLKLQVILVSLAVDLSDVNALPSYLTGKYLVARTWYAALGRKLIKSEHLYPKDTPAPR